MAHTATPFLMFQGEAEEALHLYASLFPRSDVIELARYGPDGPGPEGTVHRAIVQIAGQRFMVIDAPTEHAFSFTPSWSIFVDCETAEEQADAFARLSDGGHVLMPLDDYGFSRCFGWVADRFGVSWQLDLAR